MTIQFDGQVAIITGAGGGLGRSHALQLAARGAKVVVNDLARPEGVDNPADLVVAEIEAAGGEAMAHYANICNMDEVTDMVESTISKWGRVDILVNNAGILRDKTFVKMDLADFKLVMDVHLQGSANCTKAVWPHMIEQNYGRVVLTTSSSGLYGNFGQSNYGAAKLAMVGLMNTLVLEGQKFDIRVNCLAPVAATAMTEGLMPQEALDMLDPALVSPAVLYMVSKDAPTRVILAAGAGSYARAIITETEGLAFKPEDATPENIAANWDGINNEDTAKELKMGGQQSIKFLQNAAKAQGKDFKIG